MKQKIRVFSRETRKLWDDAGFLKERPSPETLFSKGALAREYSQKSQGVRGTFLLGGKRLARKGCIAEFQQS